MELALEINKLSKEYPGRVALEDVTFSVRKGSIHGFLGPNGAGKSTTMKIISGLLQPSAGEVKSFGTIGFLPEHPPVYPNISVRDYLEFVLKIYSNDFNKNRIEEVMAKTGLNEVGSRLIGNLSKGYQQRVGIAQAIIHSPDIIILDEPTVGLDPVAIAEIRNLILSLKNDHTILFSSHQLHDVELLCSDITLINKGKIVVSGEMGNILENLKQQSTFIAEVKRFDDQIQNELMKKLNLLSLNVSKSIDDNTFKLKISTHSKNDVRAELIKALVNADCGLVEFVQEKSDLEDLFAGIR